MAQKFDPDVDAMSEREAKLEIMRIRKLATTLSGKRNNAACWMNERILCSQILGKNPPFQKIDLTRGEFLGNCGKYFDRRQKELDPKKPRKSNMRARRKPRRN